MESHCHDIPDIRVLIFASRYNISSMQALWSEVPMPRHRRQISAKIALKYLWYAKYLWSQVSMPRRRHV